MLPTGISYDADTAILSGVLEDPDQCLPPNCWYFLFFRSKSDPNECLVERVVQLAYRCGCPDPEDYEELEAWLVAEFGSTSSQSIDNSVPFEEVLDSFNATFSAAIGLPPGISITGGIGTGSITVAGTTTSSGTYIVEFRGTVTSGPYAGCLIVHYRTYTVS